MLRLPQKNDAAPKVINCRRSAADLYEGAPSAAPAAQNQPEALQVLRLPCKTTRRPKSSIVAGLPRTSMNDDDDDDDDDDVLLVLY